MVRAKPKNNRTAGIDTNHSTMFTLLLEINVIIMIFYCGLMVHITDTRSQKVVSYTYAHSTKTVFAHDQHWEEQSSLSSPQLYRHSQKHRKWITIQQGITQLVLIHVQPWEEQNTFPALLTFLCLVCTQYPHIFITQKQLWWDANSETIHGQLLHLVSIQECWIIEE